MLHINQGGSSSVVVGSTGNIGAGIGSVSRINYSQNDGPAHRLQLNEFWRESNPLLGGSSKYVFVDRDGGVGIGTYTFNISRPPRNTTSISSIRVLNDSNTKNNSTCGFRTL